MLSNKQTSIFKNHYLVNISDLLSFINKVFLEPIKELTTFSKKNFFIWSIILLALISRLYFINDPIRIDEAGTFLQYIKGNPLRVFYYSSVNNHIFFTLLVKISTFFTGTSPASLRLVSLFSGIISILLTYLLCKEFKQSGYYAAIAMATTPYLIFYSTYARSYTLNLLITLSICLLAKKYINNNSQSGIFAISIFSGIGLLTIPTMVLPIAGIYIWIFINLILKGKGIKNTFFTYLLPISFLTIIITFIFYLPTIFLSGGINAITNAEFTEPIGLTATLMKMPSHLTSTVSELTTQIPKSLLILNTILIILGIISYLKKDSIEKLTLFPSLMFGGFIVLIIRTIIAHQRSWIFLIPFILIISDEGFTFLTKNLSRNILRNLLISVLVIGMIFCRHINELNLIDNVPLSKIFPEAPFIIKYLKKNNSEDPKGYNININNALEPNLQFYSWYYNYPIKVNGINFERSNSTFEWIKQAKLDLAKFQNKMPRRKDIRNQSSLNLNQIYIEKEGFSNNNDLKNISLERLINYSEITIYREN